VERRQGFSSPRFSGFPVGFLQTRRNEPLSLALFPSSQVGCSLSGSVLAVRKSVSIVSNSNPASLRATAWVDRIRSLTRCFLLITDGSKGVAGNTHRPFSIATIVSMCFLFPSTTAQANIFAFYIQLGRESSLHEGPPRDAANQLHPPSFFFLCYREQS